MKFKTEHVTADFLFETEDPRVREFAETLAKHFCDSIESVLSSKKQMRMLLLQEIQEQFVVIQLEMIQLIETDIELALKEIASQEPPPMLN